MTENQIATQIVDSCFRVYERMGPGLLESVYQATLAYELGKRGLNVISQRGAPVVYDEVKLDLGFRIDLLVESKVIVEVKWSTLSPMFTISRFLPTFDSWI